MPKQTYALEKDGPKRLEVSWKGAWKNVTVQLDGTPVGTIPDQKALSAGQRFELPDGSTLSLQLVKKFYTTELQILRNGQPLPGSASDPEAQVKGAYSIVFFVAGLNVVLGLVAVLFQVEFLQQVGIGAFSIGFGLVFLALGFFVMRGSLVALIIAIVIFALDAILGFVLTISGGGTPNIGGIVARVFLLIPMVQGVSAMRALKSES
jgi:hypothetical protein